MRRFAVLPLLFLATAAAAQEVLEATEMDLWCGLAFTIVAAGAPSDAAADQKALIERFAEGGQQLVDRAKAFHLESGYTDESLAARLETLRAEVVAELDSAAMPDRYSFEECSALLPF